MLMQYLRHNWRNKAEIEDLRQEIYARVCRSAAKGNPATGQAVRLHHRAQSAHQSRAPRARRSHRGGRRSGGAGHCHRCAGAGSHVIARDELRRLQDALDHFRRAAAKPSCWAASKGCRAARSPRAWASRKRPSPNISQTACALLAESLYGEAPDPESAMTMESENASTGRRGRTSKRAPPIGCSAASSGTGARPIRRDSMPGSAQSPAHLRRILGARSGVERTRTAGRAAPACRTAEAPARVPFAPCCRAHRRRACRDRGIWACGAHARSCIRTTAIYLHARRRARNGLALPTARNRTQHRHGLAHAHDDRASASSGSTRAKPISR